MTITPSQLPPSLTQYVQDVHERLHVVIADRFCAVLPQAVACALAVELVLQVMRYSRSVEAAQAQIEQFAANALEELQWSRLGRDS